jgi:hypothetical protein
MHEKQKNIKTEIPTMPQLWKHAAQYYRYQTYVLTAFGAVGILHVYGFVSPFISFFFFLFRFIKSRLEREKIEVVERIL